MKKMTIVVALLAVLALPGCVDQARVDAYNDALDRFERLTSEGELIAAGIKSGDIDLEAGLALYAKNKEDLNELAKFVKTEKEAIDAGAKGVGGWLASIFQALLAAGVAVASRGRISKGILSTLPLIGAKKADG